MLHCTVYTNVLCIHWPIGQTQFVKNDNVAETIRFTIIIMLSSCRCSLSILFCFWLLVIGQHPVFNNSMAKRDQNTFSLQNGSIEPKVSCLQHFDYFVHLLFSKRFYSRVIFVFVSVFERVHILIKKSSFYGLQTSLMCRLHTANVCSQSVHKLCAIQFQDKHNNNNFA